MVTPQVGKREVLRVRNAGVCYHHRKRLVTRSGVDFWALKNISLEVKSGETFGVIGRNGAGKSTLLRLLAGIIQPDRGVVERYGYQATLLSLQVGFVDHLSGRENVVLSGLMLGMGRTEIEEKMESIIGFAELEEFVDQPIQTYSSGMRARLGFSTAFHVEPEILLIDEVLGVGDAEFKEKSKEAMRERMRSDKTVVLVSHSLGLIRSVCDRVAWIEDGRSRMEGRTEDVAKAYEQFVEERKVSQRRRKAVGDRGP